MGPFLVLLLSTLIEMSHVSSLSPNPPKYVNASSLMVFPIYHIGMFFNNSNSSHNFKLDLDSNRIRTPVFLRASGEHVVRVKLPRGILHLLLDTGSGLIWWQCLPCDPCFTQNIDPPYRYSNSGKYKEVDCHATECDWLQRFITRCSGGGFSGGDRSCGYSIKYMDNDTTKGILATETLWTANEQFSHDIIFGCGRENKGAHFRGYYSGIMGFNKNPYSFPSQLGATLFSFCLLHFQENQQYDILYLHGFPDLAINSFNVSLLPSLFDPDSFYIQLTGIEIHGEEVSINPSEWNPNYGHGVMVDTGTFITRFPTEVYKAFRDKFVEELDYTQPIPNYSYELFDTCFQVDFYFRAPPVALVFGKNKLHLRQDQIMYRSSTSISCLAFSSTTIGHTILGSLQIQRTRLSFDLLNDIVIFSPEDC